VSEKYTVGVDCGGLSGRARTHLTGAYEPIPENPAAHGVTFAVCQLLQDHFGRGANDVIHRTRAVRREAMAERRQRSLTPATQEVLA